MDFTGSDDSLSSVAVRFFHILLFLSSIFSEVGLGHLVFPPLFLSLLFFSFFLLPFLLLFLFSFIVLLPVSCSTYLSTLFSRELVLLSFYLSLESNFVSPTINLHIASAIYSNYCSCDGNCLADNFTGQAEMRERPCALKG